MNTAVNATTKEQAALEAYVFARESTSQEFIDKFKNVFASQTHLRKQIKINQTLLDNNKSNAVIASWFLDHTSLALSDQMPFKALESFLKKAQCSARNTIDLKAILKLYNNDEYNKSLIAIEESILNAVAVPEWDKTLTNNKQHNLIIGNMLGGKDNFVFAGIANEKYGNMMLSQNPKQALAQLEIYFLFTAEPYFKLAYPGQKAYAHFVNPRGLICSDDPQTQLDSWRKTTLEKLETYILSEQECSELTNILNTGINPSDYSDIWLMACNHTFRHLPKERQAMLRKIQAHVRVEKLTDFSLMKTKNHIHFHHSGRVCWPRIESDIIAWLNKININ